MRKKLDDMLTHTYTYIHMHININVHMKRHMQTHIHIAMWISGALSVSGALTENWRSKVGTQIGNRKW